MNQAATSQPATPLAVLLALHLVPGFVFGGVFFMLARLFIQWGLTGYLALLVAVPLCLAPIEIGVMLLWSKRESGRASLSKAIRYRRPGTLVDYVVFPLLLFFGWGVLSFLVAPLSQTLDTQLSGWLPAWASQRALINGMLGISPVQRAITLGLAVLLSGFLAPVVEELYFRGFLLPRMEHWGWAAPAVNVLLFALYHFYFPGNVPGIVAAFTPVAYVVMARKNWRISLAFHCLNNLWAVYSLATFFM